MFTQSGNERLDDNQKTELLSQILEKLKGLNAQCDRINARISQPINKSVALKEEYALGTNEGRNHKQQQPLHSLQRCNLKVDPPLHPMLKFPRNSLEMNHHEPHDVAGDITKKLRDGTHRTQTTTMQPNDESKPSISNMVDPEGKSMMPSKDCENLLDDETYNIDHVKEVGEIVSSISVVRHILSAPKVEDEDWQRTSIFQMLVRCGNQARKVIIDGGSCMNVVSIATVERLKLSVQPHPQPFKVAWIDSTSILNLPKDAAIGVDTWCILVGIAKKWEHVCAKKQQKLVQISTNLVDEVWKNQQPEETNPVRYKLEGSCASKDHFRGLSFPTISSVGPNAAVMHYKLEKKTCLGLDPNNICLLDSGAQYLDGTNWFALYVLDKIHSWKDSLEFRHGTGHGVRIRGDGSDANFVMGLPRTSRGHDDITIVLDLFSKKAHFLLCSMTSNAVYDAKPFFQEVVRLHGLHNTIISDRALKFKHCFWCKLWKLLNTRLKFSCSFHTYEQFHPFNSSEPSFSKPERIGREQWHQSFKVFKRRGKKDSRAQTFIWHMLDDGVHLESCIIREIWSKFHNDGSFHLESCIIRGIWSNFIIMVACINFDQIASVHSNYFYYARVKY